MWKDGQTDTTKLTVAFRNFAKEPKSRYSAYFFNCDGTPDKKEYFNYL